MDPEARTGLDETRRLLYTIAAKVSRSEQPGAELVGTVVNSLRHHHPEFAGHADSLWESLTGYQYHADVTSFGPGDPTVDGAIAAITAALGD